MPDWWDALDDGRPIVHVTQGTLDNRDFSSLIQPALQGLADFDGHVVVSTGGAPIETLGALSANARAAEFLPYDRLLPRLEPRQLVPPGSATIKAIDYSFKRSRELTQFVSDGDVPISSNWV